MREKLKTIVKMNVERTSIFWNFFTIPYFLLKKPFHFFKEKRIMSYDPNLFAIELEINSYCNLACFNCDRSIRQARTDEEMSLENIQKFVDESIALKWKWHVIKILGGEPTLHPQFFEILKILNIYRDFNPACQITLASNGFGEKVNDVLTMIPSWVKILNTKKTSFVNCFSSYNIAPIDTAEFENKDFSKGCIIPEKSGLGLTRYGYYACGAGASVDRVFGFDIGIKKLINVTNDQLRKQMKILCSFCGHFKYFTYDHEKTSKCVYNEQMSTSWEKAYAKYSESKPKLNLY
jgi:hypothetical protein